MEVKNIILLVEIFFLLLSIISLSLICVIYSQTNDTSYSYLNSISDNWNNGIVTVVSTSNRGVQCINKNSLINDLWPGTVEGCFLFELERNGCDSDSSSNSVVPALPEMPYYVWRNTTLCSERIPSTYLDLTISENENKCPNNMRSCGIVDSLNNVMCVPLATPCPYNYMQIIPDGQPLPAGFNYTIIPLYGANLILSNQNTKGKLIVDLMLNEDIPCADSNFKSYSGIPFLLEKFYYKRTCERPLGIEKYDQEFELKDSYSYYSTYNENKIITSLNNLPNFNFYATNLMLSNRTMKLYTKSYIGMKPDCIDRIKKQKLSIDLILNLKDIYNQTYDSNNILRYSVIFGSIGVGFVLIYQFVAMCCHLKGGCDNNCNILRILILSIIHLFIMVIFIISCIMVSKYSSIEITYEFLIDFNCLDSNLSYVMSKTRDEIRSIFSISIATLVISTLNFIVMLSSWVLCYLK